MKNSSNTVKTAFFLLNAVAFLFILSASTPVYGQNQTGIGTYYADKYHGRKTASGEIYDKYDFTAAHQTLPFGTWVRVTRLDNGRVVNVKVNDRGPWTKGRIIDLSRAAAESLDMIRSGEVRVRVEVISGNENSGDIVIEDIPPKPEANPNRDLNSLPLVDYNGKPANGNSRYTVIEEEDLADYREESREYREEAREEIPEIEEEVVNPDIAKYTPQLFSFKAFKAQAEGFGVQVGAFFNFYRLLEALDDLKRKGIEDTLVQSSSKDGKSMFRIIVGPYANRADANLARKNLAKKKYKGITVNLAELY
ncbi:MAG: septal ring lytic transglycosylase RlpA family protein [Bacteroidia bacterium]|nr:septal ring lytic transglycosylase RlpA family protein [Bacteroidia bacterium]